MNKTSTPDQRIKRRRICQDNDIMTPPSIPTSTTTHTTSEETPYHPPEQSQQSTGCKVSSGGCDGTNTNCTGGMTTDGTTHQSSGHVSLSQSNPIQRVPGSISSQGLQSRIPPVSGEGERNPQSINASAFRHYDPGSGSGHTTNDGNCLPWYTLESEAPDLSSRTEPTADSGSCIPWFSEFDSMLGPADTSSCIPWFSEELGPEVLGSKAGALEYVQGFQTNI